MQSPHQLSWRALKQQFGAGFNRIDNFKTTFTSNSRLALAVYREAKVRNHSGWFDPASLVAACRPAGGQLPTTPTGAASRRPRLRRGTWPLRY